MTRDQELAVLTVQNAALQAENLRLRTALAAIVMPNMHDVPAGYYPRMYRNAKALLAAKPQEAS
mgnify:CR=1 FL=1